MRSLLLSSLVMFLQACSFSGSPPPEEHFYRLPELAAEKTQQQFDSIYLRPVIAEGIYNERAMLYVKDDTPLEVRRYHYHFWLNTPAKLIHEQFKAYLESSALSRQLVSQHSSTNELELNIKIKNFERRVGASNRIQLALEVEVYPSGQYKPVLSKTYQLESPAGSTMHDAASGFGQALSVLFGQILLDLKNLKNP